MIKFYMKKYINDSFLLFILGGLIIFVHMSSFIFLKSFLIYFFLTAAYALSWNLMAGLCGQYSFGHAVYAGIGSYLAAFSFNQGIEFFCIAVPMILLFNGMLGGGIVFLSRRFKVDHAYFTLLTIASLECVRILFENMPYFNGVSGYFVKNNATLNFLYTHFLIIIFILMSLIFFCSKKIYRSNFALKCMALEVDKLAAESIGINPVKNPIIMMFISSVFTAFIGVVSIFYYKNLFPEQVFSQQRSMHMILPALIAGSGYKSPLFGALILVILSEILDLILEYCGIEISGIKQVIFGIVLLFFVLIKMRQKNLKVL